MKKSNFITGLRSVSKQRILGLLLTAVICLTALAGCGVEDDNKDQGSDLEIYYLINHDYYSVALAEFYRLYHFDYNIILTGFESDEDMQNQLATEIAAGKGPDVVLMSSESDFDIYKAVRSGNIEELSSYYAADESFNIDDYYQPVLDGGEFQGGQYIVPFSFSLDMLSIETELLENAGYSADQVNSYYDYVSVIEKAGELAGDELLKLISASYGNRQYSTVGRYLENSGIEILNEDGEVSDDIGDIKAVMEFLLCIQQDFSAKRDYIMESQSVIAFDKTYCMSANGNYPVMWLMIHAITSDLFNKEYTLLPWKNVDGFYQPVISDYGFINKNSKQKDAAFLLLRFLMDYEIPVSIRYPLSVNRSVVESEFTMLERNKQVALQLENGSNLYAKLLDEAARGEMEDVLEHMGTAIVYNTGYYDIAVDQIRRYCETQDAEAAISDLKAALDRYLRE